MSEMMKVIILAVVQGVAEFLPISSSGHLAVLSNIFELPVTETTEMVVVLHAGTLLAIVIFYFRELLGLILKPDGRKLLPWIIIATIPVGITGVAMHALKIDEFMEKHMIFPGIGFLITATLLMIGRKSRKDGTPLHKISLKQALIIGFAQAVAILPGVSRSGSTISTAQKVGVDREAAGTFSFLLAVPAISGAVLVKLLSAIKKTGFQIDSTHNIQLLVGFAVSAVVGYLSLLLLVFTIKKGKLSYYSVYCFILGLVVIGWWIFSRC
jgi:undecaprenyl-diphosphatase